MLRLLDIRAHVIAIRPTYVLLSHYCVGFPIYSGTSQRSKKSPLSIA
jgi:hypothetical protein